jgi:thioredoxin reductase
MINKDFVIIGGGSAGMAAAVGAYDHGVKDILIIERSPFLGRHFESMHPQWFRPHRIQRRADRPGICRPFHRTSQSAHIPYVLDSTVTSINRDKVVVYTSAKEGVVEVQAKAIIMATGCYERKRRCHRHSRRSSGWYLNRGQAQLFLNEYGYLVGKRIFILGSGDIGLIMARRLTLEGAKVLGVAEIMPWSNGLNRNMVQCLYDFNIPLYLSHTVSKVVGKERVERIEISQVDAHMKAIPGTEQSFNVDTLILSIGLIPNNDLLNSISCTMSRTRGAIVNEHFETDIDGIFSCGNVLHVHDLVDNVVAEAREAGKGAALYIQGKLPRENQMSSPASLAMALAMSSRRKSRSMRAMTICSSSSGFGRHPRMSSLSTTLMEK